MKSAHTCWTGSALRCCWCRKITLRTTRGFLFFYNKVKENVVLFLCASCCSASRYFTRPPRTRPFTDGFSWASFRITTHRILSRTEWEPRVWGNISPHLGTKFIFCRRLRRIRTAQNNKGRCLPSVHIQFNNTKPEQSRPWATKLFFFGDRVPTK